MLMFSILCDAKCHIKNDIRCIQCLAMGGEETCHQDPEITQCKRVAGDLLCAISPRQGEVGTPRADQSRRRGA